MNLINTTNNFILSQCIGFLNTPAIWENKQFGIQQFQFPEIDLNNFTSNSLKKRLRLGHQIEYIFKQLINHNTNYIVLLHNLPIRHKKKTLGEIDFILKNVISKQLIHIELTYKFYIINSEISEPIKQLIGPNKRDAFSKKIEKIKNRQFKLLHTEEGFNALAKHDISNQDIVHQACFKGQLFLPYNNKSSVITPLNQKCIYGFWLRLEEFNNYELKNHQFYIPIKSEWIIEPYLEVKWVSHSEILLEVTIQINKENSPMVWIKKSNTDFDKCFVIW